MSKICTLILCCFFVTSGLYAMAVPGSCTFTFTPNGTEGSSGSWKAKVYSPNGQGFSTDSVDYSVTTPVTLTVETPGPGMIDLGYYIIELVCDINGSISGPFLDSISVQFESTEDFSWDTIVYHTIPTLASGERTVMFYAIPVLPSI